MSWATIEERDDDGLLVWYHVMPMVSLDGDLVISAAHDVSTDCHCRPILDGNIWQHYDPDHDGSMSNEEWNQKKIESQRKVQ